MLQLWRLRREPKGAEEKGREGTDKESRKINNVMIYSPNYGCLTQDAS